jgi:ABC-type sugar transport system ATPase subunit
MSIQIDQQVMTLSPGQRQALTILIAGLRQAEIVLLDEPLAALDATNAEICAALILDLKIMGKTLLYVTHRVGQTESRLKKMLGWAERSL